MNGVDDGNSADIPANSDKDFDVTQDTIFLFKKQIVTNIFRIKVKIEQDIDTQNLKFFR